MLLRFTLLYRYPDLSWLVALLLSHIDLITVALRAFHAAVWTLRLITRFTIGRLLLPFQFDLRCYTHCPTDLLPVTRCDLVLLR